VGVNSELYGDDVQEFPHIYRGVVEDTNDPARAGRIRVRILGVHSDNVDYVPTDSLPWAISATPIGTSGGGLRNIGTYKVPDIGSHVFCFFEAGDHNFPVYFACAPAIELLTDYQEKDGKFKNNLYEFDKSKQYDDSTNYSDKKDFYETPNDDNLDEEKQVQDWPAQTRKNTFEEGAPANSVDPPGYKKLENQPIFPQNFFQTDIRIAFDGKANHDTTGYDGIYQTKPSTKLTPLETLEELDLWAERKWGYNDDDKNHQHDFNGGKDWKPEYPMCSTERNSQGEIVDSDILKERKTYIHPSKYFVEHIQLDAQRKKEDFLNEKSIKNIYERQRGTGSSPAAQSNPEKIKKEGQSNEVAPIVTTGIKWNGRGNNKITYDDIDGGTRTKNLERFEERKHNPGREKTVIEDFVYRFYMNKVNETYQVDRNTRFYRGNDNTEVEHGDINQRLHRGCHNMHLDDGNYNRTVNKGWYHLHIDNGHHFVELGGQNDFTTSSQHESEVFKTYCDNQHKETTIPNGADNEGCDAKFNPWPFTEGENECKNQFFLLHDGYQIFRLERGSQHFQINNGDQKFWIIKGHQTFHLENGDQRFQLNSGNIERYVNGTRITFYTKKCKENTAEHWQLTAAEYIKLQSASSVILQSATGIRLDAPNVEITGNLLVDGNILVTGPAAMVSGIDTPGISGTATSLGGFAVQASASGVSDSNDSSTIESVDCVSVSQPIER
jgi:hypothetical protein